MVEPEKKGEFKCKFCGMTFVSKEEFEKHLKSHKSDSTK
jgi:uncharacterized C2H2 Zn-finger protein